jgi:hypothetical protein
MTDMHKLVTYFGNEGYDEVPLTTYHATPLKKQDRMMTRFENGGYDFLKVGLGLTFKFTKAGKLKGMV